MPRGMCKGVLFPAQGVHLGYPFDPAGLSDIHRCLANDTSQPPNYNQRQKGGLCPSRTILSPHNKYSLCPKTSVTKHYLHVPRQVWQNVEFLPRHHVAKTKVAKTKWKIFDAHIWVHTQFVEEYKTYLPKCLGWLCRSWRASQFLTDPFKPFLDDCGPFFNLFVRSWNDQRWRMAQYGSLG
jgi:hypothetical protein